MNRFESETLLSRLTRKSLESMLGLWEKVSGTRLTYNARPSRLVDVGIWSDARSDLPPFALILQGPILTENDFTLESALLYRRTFPDAQLILSTWINEDAGCLEGFRKNGIDVVTSERPQNPGRQNVNYQLVSSSAGMKRARELGAHYAMKTRTDQRLYAMNVQAMMMNLLEMFPLKKTEKQKRRIIGVGLNTFKFRLYGLSDMLTFGHIDDMSLYWGASLSDKRQQNHEGESTWRQAAVDRLCETYLETEFLMQVGHPLAWTLEDSWRVLGDRFCVVDSMSLDIYWPKYTRFRENRRMSYSARTSDEFVTFMQWLSFYTGDAFKQQVPEGVLDATTQVLTRPKTY